MTDLDVKLKHAAYHEAAHAVVAYIVSICLERLFLDLKEGGFGLPSDPDWATADLSVMPYPHDRIKFPLAGMAIDKIRGDLQFARDQEDNEPPRFARQPPWVSYPVDVCVALGIAELVTRLPEKRWRLWHKSFRRTESLLREPMNRAAVKALAQALLDRRSLTGDETCRIIREAMALA